MLPLLLLLLFFPFSLFLLISPSLATKNDSVKRRGEPLSFSLSFSLFPTLPQSLCLSIPIASLSLLLLSRQKISVAKGEATPPISLHLPHEGEKIFSPHPLLFLARQKSFPSCVSLHLLPPLSSSLFPSLLSSPLLRRRKIPSRGEAHVRSLFTYFVPFSPFLAHVLTAFCHHLEREERGEKREERESYPFLF